MIRDINLVNPALLPPRPFFQFRSMVLALSVMIVVLLAFGVLIHSSVASYEREAQASDLRVASRKAQVDTQEQRAATIKIDPALQAEQQAVASERHRLDALAAQLAQLDGPAPAHSASSVLFALASHPADGVWLMQITFDDEHLSLQGYALHAADLPRWLGALQDDAAFAGQRFGSFEFGTPGDAVEKTASRALPFQLVAQKLERDATHGTERGGS